MNNSTAKQGQAAISHQSENIYQQLSPSFYLRLVIIEVILATATTVGNSLLLFAICRDPLRCLRNPTVYLIANLAVADLLVGFFVGFCRAMEMFLLYRGQQTPLSLNTVQYIIAGSAMFAAVYSIIAMSWDRFVAVSDPTNYRTKVTVKRVKICLLAVWPTALCFAVLPAAGVRKLDFLVAYCYSHFVLPAIILTLVYIVIFKRLSKKLQALDQVVHPQTTDSNNRKTLYRERKLAATILLVLLTFYVCFAPYFVKVHLWLLCDCQKSTPFLITHFITNDVLLLSSLLDPIIYGWRLERFRKTFRMVIGSKRNRPIVLPSSSAN